MVIAGRVVVKVEVCLTVARQIEIWASLNSESNLSKIGMPMESTRRFEKVVVDSQGIKKV